jgi:hypothetical protein
MKKYLISACIILGIGLQSVALAADSYEVIPETKADPNASVNCVAGK